MKVKILGAHQGESRDTRFMSMIIDDQLVIDAGGLTSSLTLKEQDNIEAVLITHRHFDHIKDLPPLAHNLWHKKSLQVYCIEDTRKALQEHIFNGVIWPDVTRSFSGYHPLVYHTVEPGHAFDVLGYRVLPIEVPHTVPATGYLVEREGKSLFYTADTSGEGRPPWASVRPDLLVIETTMSSEYNKDAARFKHLTPLTLGWELKAFHKKQGYYPHTLCVHINPEHEQRIREELSALSHELGADITAAHEGLVIEL